jgi:hypothetical protein
MISPAFKESILLDKNLEWHPIYKIVKGEKKESGSKSFIVRIADGHPSLNLLNRAREKIMELAC